MKIDSAVSEAAQAHLRVDLAAIVANFRKLRRMAPASRTAAVVKADAYGLGARAVVPALVEAGCDMFVVARLREGIMVRQMAPDARILVLDGAPEHTIPGLLRYRLTPALSSLDEIAAFAAIAKTCNTVADAAIHIDTGMNRLGLEAEEVSVLAREAAVRLDGLNIVLWMSHLACSDDADSAMNAAQLSRFREALAILPPAPASLAASGGVCLGAEYHFDVIRPGIALYGGNPVPALENPFETAVHLHSHILQVRHAPKGSTVGYSATHTLTRDSLLATIGYGYADGWLRTLSNTGYGAIGGVRVPRVGRVSMDLSTYDVTDVPGDLHPGMEIELIGDTVSLAEVAGAAGTIPYEILTALSHRAARSYQEAV